MRKINIGLIGWGTVGTGVLKILRKNGALVAQRLGARPVISRIADLDLRKDRGIKVSPAILTRDADQILTDPGIEIVVELIGGIEPAREYIRRALSAGKLVVTANKALLAEKGRELFDFARRHRSRIFYEASVGGGIPVIKSLREGMVADRITSVLGIINGTCNYILSRMEEERKPLKKVLAEAQKKGYAEPDPALDLEGIDSAHKLVILASLAFGGWIDFNKVYVEGIGEILPEDIIYTGDLGYRIKLLGIAKRATSGIEIRVHPTLLARQHSLASVGEVYNAIYVESDFCGQNIFQGQGAGAGPAASSVVADLVEAGREILSGNRSELFPGPPITPLKILPIESLQCRHYVRIPAIDRPGVLAKISSILGSFGISIASVIQRGRRKKGVVPLILMTHAAREKALRKAVSRINRLSVVRGRCLRLRVEE